MFAAGVITSGAPCPTPAVATGVVISVNTRVRDPSRMSVHCHIRSRFRIVRSQEFSSRIAHFLCPGKDGQRPSDNLLASDVTSVQIKLLNGATATSMFKTWVFSPALSSS